MVSAEMAMWSILGAMAVGVVIWGCLQGVVQVRCSEVAAQAARLEARGDTAAMAGLQDRNSDLVFAREQRDGLARVRVSGEGPTWGFLEGLPAHATASVDMEADT